MCYSIYLIGPIVYRLGHRLFMPVSGVRLSVGSQILKSSIFGYCFLKFVIPRVTTLKRRYVRVEQKSGLQNYGNKSRVHGFYFHNFVAFLLGQNFECFVNTEGIKQNTKVMTDSP